jgi:hypothetical protein
MIAACPYQVVKAEPQLAPTRAPRHGLSFAAFRPALLALLGCLGSLPASAEDVPLPRPRPAEEIKPLEPPPEPASPETPVPPPRPLDLTDDGAATAGETQADAACKDLLGREGVAAEPLPPIVDGACGVPHPIRLSKLPGDVSLKPAITTNCAVGLALTEWIASSVAPSARSVFAGTLASLEIGTSYQCRSQNNQAGAKLSEHAFGNGVDVAAFRLADGRRVEVGTGDADAARFVAEVRAAACKTFSTVLGPGSDAEHGNHLHLDLRARKHDYRICQ